MGAILTFISSLAAADPVPTTEMEPLFPQQQSAGDLLDAGAYSRLTNVGRERGSC